MSVIHHIGILNLICIGALVLGIMFGIAIVVIKLVSK